MVFLKKIYKRTVPFLPGYYYLCLILRKLRFLDLETLKRIPITPSVPVRVNSLDGSFYMTNPGRCSIAKSLFWTYGILHPKEDKFALDLFCILAKRCNVIIDIGANSGIFTLAAHASNPDAEKLTFDILPESYHVLIDNLIYNNMLENVSCNLVGVGKPKSSYSAPFGQVSSEMMTSLSTNIKYKADKAVSVNIKDLDQICNDEVNDNPVLIKIDVEGTELDIFDNANMTLSKIRPFIFCEVLDLNSNYMLYDTILSQNNYLKYLIMENGIQVHEKIIPNEKYKDWLFCPKELIDTIDVGLFSI